MLARRWQRWREQFDAEGRRGASSAATSGHERPSDPLHSECWACASGGASVLVVKTADVRKSNDLSAVGRCDLARFRRLLVQREMRSRRVIIGKVGSQEPLEMAFVQNDDVIEALAADGADQAFDIVILPG